MLVYQCGLDVSTAHLSLLAKELRKHLAETGTRWRVLNPSAHAKLVLAYLRHNRTYQQLADGFHIGRSTVHRYIREALTLLAALAPTLDQALQAASALVHVILDGTVVDIDRVRQGVKGADKEFYSGKTHRHGMNLQVLAGPLGHLLWESDAIGGASADITCARQHGILEKLEEYPQVTVLADKGYQGAGPRVKVPFKPSKRNKATGETLPLSRNQKLCNSSFAKQRALGERANAQLKSWQVLRRVRCSPERTTELAKAITVLIRAAY